MKKYYICICIFIFLLFCFVNVIFFNHISSKQKNNIENINDILNIENDFKDNYKISQKKLLKYLEKKSSVLYETNGTITKKEVINNNVVYSFSDNEGNVINGIIEKNKATFDIKDKVYLVGTINYKNEDIKINRLENKELNYITSKKMNISDLQIEIDKLKKVNFIIDGYMVTDKTQYKLYNSKDDYKNNKDYFVISWNDKFNLTGNASVELKCTINDSYNLNNCELLKQK